MTPESHLLLQIQKSLKSILSEISLVIVALHDSASTLSSISNLSEQLQCCLRYDGGRSCLSDFPDLQFRLSYKIGIGLDEKMKELQLTVKEIEDAASKVSSHHHNLMEVYNKDQDRVSVTYLCKGQPLHPAPALMMEWVSDIDREVSFILLEKRHLLDTCDLRSEESVKNLVNSWKHVHNLKKKNSEVKAYTHFFMDEKFT